MNKRSKMVLTSVLLTLGLWGTQLVDIESRYQAIGLLAGVSYGLSVWALFEDLRGLEWFTVLILPVMYSVAVALFYFLLPERILSRVIIMGLFSIGMYALLLTENIFNVAAMRTIQLLRAAHAVGFLLTLLVAFFLWDTIFSFKLAGWWNGLFVLVTGWPLIFQALWSVNLELNITKKLLNYSFVLSWSLMCLAVMISFWQITIAVASLFLVSGLYVGLGLMQHALSGRLFKETIKEYLGVGLIVFIITILLSY